MKKPIERAEVVMERLGFNENSSDGVKAAFVKNLIKQAYGIEVPLPTKYVEPTLDDFLQIHHDHEPVQLSFNLDSNDSPKAG